MTSAGWLGVAAALAIVGVHATLQHVAHRMARRASTPGGPARFVIGGMVVRMGVVLLLTALVLALAPVDRRVFAGVLVGLLVLTTIAESARAAWRTNDRSDHS